MFPPVIPSTALDRKSRSNGIVIIKPPEIKESNLMISMTGI
jgi:hypothetical protein